MPGVIAAALAGVAFGFILPAVQHNLYSEAEYRATPASGRTLWLLRIFSMVVAGAGLAFAFRPDLYDAASGHAGKPVEASDPIGAFVGPAFNPADIAGHLAAFKIGRQNA